MVACALDLLEVSVGGGAGEGAAPPPGRNLAVLFSWIALLGLIAARMLAAHPLQRGRSASRNVKKESI